MGPIGSGWRDGVGGVGQDRVGPAEGGEAGGAVGWGRGSASGGR